MLPWVVYLVSRQRVLKQGKVEQMLAQTPLLANISLRVFSRSVKIFRSSSNFSL